MSFANIRSALVQAYIDAQLGIDTRYPNVNFKPVGTPWAALDIITSRTFVATLGNGGEDWVRGILQISLNFEPDTGDGLFYSFLDQLRQQFTAGKTFTFDGTWVRVISTSPRPTMYNPPYMTGIVEVEWESRINRTNII